jgi:hypothetical protein
MVNLGPEFKIKIVALVNQSPEFKIKTVAWSIRAKSLK